MQESPDLIFGLQIQAHPRMVSIVRRFVEESVEKILGDPDAAFRVSLAVHELLEHATKYAVGDETGLAIRFESNGAGVSIRLTNQTTPTNLARLRSSIAEIQLSDEPYLLYQDMMRGRFGRREMDEESGLGLARIRAEGGLNLSLETEGSTVSVVASCLPKSTTITQATHGQTL